MKYLKYFENSQDERSEVWEIDDQFIDLMNNDDYVLMMLRKIGMDKKNIKLFREYKLPGIKDNIKDAKKLIVQKLYLYFKKVYDIDYVQGYQYIPIIRTRPWENLPDDCDYMGHIKVEDYELQTIKYNL